jgi:ATP phosphoribosyltransferase
MFDAEIPSDETSTTTALRLALPKGRMADGVGRLLSEAGIDLTGSDRGYRPTASLSWLQVKRLKPQNTVEMLQFGSRDVGFAGADWVAELDADVVELLDTELDPVRVVAAAPPALVARGLTGPLVIASEYAQLTQRWIEERGLDARLVRSYGATEVFPPEDADLIVDNTATGSTLRANDLEIIDELMRSSTRMYASPAALEDPEKRARIERLVLLVRSVLDARKRAMLEVNVGPDGLDRVVDLLPCMREPTISRLYGEAGFAVKAAVPRRALPELIPRLKAAGASDLVVSRIDRIVL